ncbi:hypothetical protein [Pedobacter sp. JY14-1]|uniref:hypothetical protein n=1 Tax=Pedobacter sp. JY14-1 TaxID=3034151 RepID=UPI0023E139FF|nr:hypothetical protein [Pedobacter sp. JY14-1]
MFKLYLKRRSVNPATEHYISLIERAVAGSGFKSSRVNSLNEIGKGDIIITVEAKDCFFAGLRYPHNIKINWFQGITPEEAFLVYRNPLRKWLWRIFESLTLRHADFNLFVSQAMLQHYRHVYGYARSNYLIMPCYNQQIREKSFFTTGKYRQPSFIYVGTLSAWQQIDLVLSVFAIVEKQNHKATLRILTHETAQAHEKVKAYGITNVVIESVPLNMLANQLAIAKYGFLLRADHSVNRVATPTKMNSYLAHGVIPIYSDVIDDFKTNLNISPFALPVHAGATATEIAKEIHNFENQLSPDAGVVLEQYSEAFKRYYNDEYYINRLAAALKGIVAF